MGWSPWAGVPGSIRDATAAEVEVCTEGPGLETVGGGTVATVVAGGATCVGLGCAVTASEGGDAPPGGTTTPGSGWGCGCTGGLAVADGVGLTDGRGDWELLGEHMPTTPKRPCELQDSAPAVSAGASAIRHNAKGSATRATGTFRRVMASTLPTLRQLGRQPALASIPELPQNPGQFGAIFCAEPGKVLGGLATPFGADLREELLPVRRGGDKGGPPVCGVRIATHEAFDLELVHHFRGRTWRNAQPFRQVLQPHRIPRRGAHQCHERPPLVRRQLPRRQLLSPGPAQPPESGMEEIAKVGRIRGL